ncbi:hypothetical protein LO772_16700 [Yinghuangia sp. ASG 101]|uniref:hypothetical protein n=1 Tax=Yinghuangia sp. ASG 101 TaxID=2896848 RepID=UPI001E3BE959|nr:hypothetical protein [Yinghuangia sp. ASG 101]UGQ15055.1 hypothetical protein LO772_16700 [Yinghuangia sp. ASG 101]
MPFSAADRPRLATPAQQDAERTLLRLLRDPELQRVKTSIRDGLAATPRGRTASGAATLDHAVDLWTNSLVMAEISIHQPVPAFTWGTDNTPRTWLGHTLPGVGTSGDNPDAFYRLAVIDGTQRYEVLGRFDPARRPAQVTLELHKGAKVTPPPMDGNFSDLMPLASITDRDLDVASDGTFRFTVGPEPESPVHMVAKPGVLTLGIRDMLADWSGQVPCALELRPLDAVTPREFTDEDILRATYKDLPPYVAFWSGFPEVWFGGLKGNVISPGHTRTGSLAGFTVAIGYDLAPDEAVVVTMDPTRAAYTGFQVMDPWMISADSTRHQVSLNNSQSTPDADGTVTYVIAAADPGVANWLSTAGQHSGLALMRWQAVPDAGSIDPASLARGFRVVKLADVAGLGLPRVTPERRAAQLAARIAGYKVRTS